MIVNSRTRGINRGRRKLVHKYTLNYKKKNCSTHGGVKKTKLVLFASLERLGTAWKVVGLF